MLSCKNSKTKVVYILLFWEILRKCYFGKPPVGTGRNLSLRNWQITIANRDCKPRVGTGRDLSLRNWQPRFITTRFFTNFVVYNRKFSCTNVFYLCLLRCADDSDKDKNQTQFLSQSTHLQANTRAAALPYRLPDLE